MMPQNAASIVAVPGLYPPPDDQVTLPLIDYEDGGVAIQDPSQGLTGYTWRVYQVNLDVYVQRDTQTPVLQFSQSGIVELSLAFDQNMRPHIAYATDDGHIHLRWYNSLTHLYTTTDFGIARNPRLTLDDKRQVLSSISDVLLAYIRSDNVLCVRQQRDRFGVEIELVTGILPSTKLKNIGMNNNYRVQFELA